MSAIDGDARPLVGLRPAEPAVATRPPRGRRRYADLRFARWVSPIVVLAIWQLTHVFKLISPTKLPPPSTVVNTGYNLIAHPIPAFGSLQGALLVSAERFAIGFAAGATVAILLALVVGLNATADVTIDPLAQSIRTLPLFGLIPVFIIWFGIGTFPKILLIALAAAIPLYLNASAGVRSIDTRLYDLGKVLQISRTERLRHIVLPGALPQALVGLRLSLASAWLSLVVAEQIAASAGLGAMINQAETFLRNDVIFVALIVYTLLGLLTDWIVRVLERRALAWRTDLVVR